MNPKRQQLTTTLFVLVACLLGASQADATQGATLAEVEALLDEGRSAAALARLEQISRQGHPSAQVLLLRSTARTMEGDLEGSLEDLHRVLKLDPKLRRAWLSVAGLEIAQARYREAHTALLEAQKLDPAAPDNHLNLGAVLVLQKELGPAGEHFEKYLALHPHSAESYYLVASNYALVGSETAVKYLHRAVELDERMRLRARSDERFLGLSSPAYERLLTTDSYRPPAGAHTAAAAFREPYQTSEPRLLYAVVAAMNRLDEPYEPPVEATESWALFLGEMRVKVYTQANDTGVVSVSAPPSRLTAAEFERRTKALFRAIQESLDEAPAPLRRAPASAQNPR